MGSLILAVTLLGIACGAAYSLIKPRWALIFIIVLYPLEQLLTTTSGFFASNNKILNALIGALAVVGAATAFVAGKKPLRGYFNAAFMVTIGLYVYGMIGIAFSPDPQKGMTDLVAGLPYLGLLLLFPGLLVNSLDDFRRLVVPTMVVGASIITLILLSPNTSMFSGRLGIEGAGPMSGEIQNPLATAGLGGTIVIFGMLYKPERGVVLVNLIRAGAITVGLIMALLSGSRGQLLGAIICGVVMFPFARQIRNLVQFFTASAAALIVLVFVMGVLSLAMTEGAADRLSSGAINSGVSTRAQLITGMMGEYLSRPESIVQGLGTSSFDYYWNVDDTPYIHNVLAQILTENGLIGAGIVLLLLALVARAGWQLLRMHRDSARELSTAAILVGYCLYQFVLSLKQGNWFTSAAPFWTFLILTKVHARSIVDAREAAAWEAYAASYEEYEARAVPA